MTNQNPQHTQPAPDRRTAPLAWSSRLELTTLGTGEPAPGQAPGGSAEDRRPRTSKIEKEIIWAVVVLYAGIIACFAGLHLYGVALG
ncbi:hypothetical protein [Leucobacter sp. PH1c]|uniref:hypothetical protein n=1 Tax=Leucobacter sp. PH1c TaxID=1397278 RepID=UPI000469C59C|nr:hypothetical protein [Leucobacter sp. PH1c]